MKWNNLIFNKWIIYVLQQSHLIQTPKLKAFRNNSLPNLPQEICGSLQWEMELQVSDHILHSNILLTEFKVHTVLVSFLERGENINRKFLKIWEDEGGSMVILIPRGRTDLFVSTKNFDLWTFPEVALP